MPRYWTSYWKSKFWREGEEPEGETISQSGSSLWTKRHVVPGDEIFVVSMLEGRLRLGAKMIVEKIVCRDEIPDNEDLYPTEEWAIGREGSGTPLDLHRELAPDVTARLQFVTSAGLKTPFFREKGNLDKQAVRGIRELAPASARLLADIIEKTDKMARQSGQMLTVTQALIVGSFK